ncbi:MAG: hypothetical protein HY608_04485 [Planctomycetes bacterium]|nr:hypothetical protein [Planctomycetota bacterium]
MSNRERAGHRTRIPTILPAPSKPHFLRAVWLAAAMRGWSTLQGLESSGDLAAIARLARAAGGEIRARRGTWSLRRRAGARTERSVDVGESAFSARLAIAWALSRAGRTRITGRASLLRRHIGDAVPPALEGRVRWLRSRGTLPLEIVPGRVAREVRLAPPRGSTAASGQPLTAWILAAASAGGAWRIDWPGKIVGPDHLRLTCALVRGFGGAVRRRGATFHVDPERGARRLRIPRDATQAGVFALGALLAGHPCRIGGIDLSGDHPDLALLRRLRGAGRIVQRRGGIEVRPGPIPPLGGDYSRMPDAAVAAAALAAFGSSPVTLRGVRRLRAKESDRLALLARNLRRLGARVGIGPDSLRVTPAREAPRGPIRLEAGGDHRLAMVFGTIARVRRGVRVSGEDAVSKSDPAFFRRWTPLVSAEAGRAGPGPRRSAVRRR